MLVRHTRLIAAASVLVLSMASAAGAEVLWDQSTLMPTPYDGSFDESSNSCNAISGNTKVHIANDVHFDLPVHITTVRIYETPGNVQAATQAYLWIRPKTSVLPTTSSDSLELPSTLVNITPVTVGTGSSQYVRVSATGLDIELPAGDYWVSLTPRHNHSNLLPYTFHIIAAGPVIGDPGASIVGCTVNSNWTYPHPSNPDFALMIEGEFHAPTAPLPTGQRGEASTP